MALKARAYPSNNRSYQGGYETKLSILILVAEGIVVDKGVEIVAIDKTSWIGGKPTAKCGAVIPSPKVDEATFVKREKSNMPQRLLAKICFFSSFLGSSWVPFKALSIFHWVFLGAFFSMHDLIQHILAVIRESYITC